MFPAGNIAERVSNAAGPADRLGTPVHGVVLIILRVLHTTCGVALGLLIDVTFQGSKDWQAPDHHTHLACASF